MQSSPHLTTVTATSFSLAKATLYHHPHSKCPETAVSCFDLTVLMLLFSWRRFLQITIPGSRDWSHNLVKETWWEIKRMRHSNGEWEVYSNKEKCPSTYQYLKSGFMVLLCYLQAQASFSRTEHTKDTCNIIQLSNNNDQSPYQQRIGWCIFCDFTHKKGSRNCIKCM